MSGGPRCQVTSIWSRECCRPTGDTGSILSSVRISGCARIVIFSCTPRAVPGWLSMDTDLPFYIQSVTALRKSQTSMEDPLRCIVNSGMREMALAIFRASSDVSLAWPKDHFRRSSRQNTPARMMPLASFTTNESGCSLSTVQGGENRQPFKPRTQPEQMRVN